MDFNDFLMLNENKHRETIDFEKAKQLILKNCKLSIKNPPLYRGSHSWEGNNIDQFLIDPSKTVRVSAGGKSNVYTICMDKVLSNEDNNLPLRSKATIVTGNKSVSEYFGGIRYIIPYDNANIGKVPEQDLWILKLNNTSVTFEELQDNFSSFHGKSYKDVVNYIKLKLNENNDFFIKLFKNVDQNEIDNHLQYLFNLKDLKFKFMKGKDKRAKSNNEFWISGKSVAITESLYNDLIKDLK